MTHKFSVGDKVKIKTMIDDLPIFKESIGTITRLFAWTRLSHANTCEIIREYPYEVKVGYVYYTVHEEGLEKIEESAQILPTYKVGDTVVFHPDEDGDVSQIGTIAEVRKGEFNDIYEYCIKFISNLSRGIIKSEWVKQVWINCFYKEHAQPKYKIGDRVLFHFTADEVVIGHIEEIDSQNTYKVLFGNSYYILTEKDIIEKSTLKQEQKVSQEFKEGDEVWIKGKITRHFINVEEIIDKDGDIRVDLRADSVAYYKPHELFKLIPSPKNEWVSVKDRLPEEGSQVHIFTKKYIHQIAKVTIYEWENKEHIFWASGVRYSLNEITHWKPLDAPPTE